MSNPEEKFEKLQDGLRLNLLNANHHLKLHRNLREAVAEYRDEMNQCRVFWSLTINSHLEVGVLNLCRAYDGNSKSLSLEKFLKYISDNKNIFSTEKFCERLKDNQYLEYLNKIDRVPSDEEIEKDVESVSKQDPLVKKLICLRSNIVAHTNEKVFLSNMNPESIDLFTYRDTQLLVERGLSIYNKYSSLFKAKSYANILIGEDDYKGVLHHYRQWKNYLERGSINI